jgi:hypothetical protein
MQLIEMAQKYLKQRVHSCEQAIRLVLRVGGMV